MTRYEELQSAIRIANANVHYLKQDHETDHVESLCAEIDQLRARVARLTRNLEFVAGVRDRHIAMFNDEQARVAEVEQDKARLEHVMSGKGITVRREGRNLVCALWYLPTREEIDAAIDAAKGQP